MYCTGMAQFIPAIPLPPALRERLAAACQRHTLEQIARGTDLARVTVAAARAGRPVHRSTGRLLALYLDTVDREAA